MPLTSPQARAVSHGKYQLDVTACDVADVVRHAGGWLYDRAMAGWDVAVTVTDDDGAFAAAVEPSNAEIPAFAERCRALRVDGKPTLPSTIARERRVNPFLRTTEDEVVRSALAHGATGTDSVDVLAALRTWKNAFR